MKESVNTTLEFIQPPRKKGRLKKTLAITAIVVLVIGIAVLAAMPPVIMHDMVDTRVQFKRTWTAEEYGLASKKLALTTDDNLKIAAYEVSKEKPKAVVIFISGIHNPSVTAYYGHAKMLYDQGYASVLIELRAHGESEGEGICLGFKEYLDTRAVVDYIKSEAKYENTPIVVYGVSMGGATAINSIGEIPEIDGLVSLSAYSAWEDVFCDAMVNMGAPKWLAAVEKPFVKLYTTFKYGLDSFAVSPKDEIRKLGSRPALLIHSTGDTEIPYTSFERLSRNAPGHVQTWTREGNLHLILEGDDFLHPQKDVEYSKRILEFMNTHFK